MAVGQRLTDWENGGSGDVFFPPLGAGIKYPQRVDFVVKKLAPHRGLCPRREYIQNSAPQSKLSRPFHLLTPAVACRRQTAAQSLYVMLLAGNKLCDGVCQHRLWDAPLAQSVGGGYHGLLRLVQQPVQGFQPLIGPLAALHRTGPQGKLPPRQQQGALPRQGLQIACQPLALALVAAHSHKRALHRAAQRRCAQAAVHRPKPCHQCAALPAGKLLLHMLHFGKQQYFLQYSFQTAASSPFYILFAEPLNFLKS